MLHYELAFHLLIACNEMSKKRFLPLIVGWSHLFSIGTCGAQDHLLFPSLQVRDAHSQRVFGVET